MNDLIEPGSAPHYCPNPNLDIRIRDGAVWQCECGKRWQLHSEQTGPGSWQGEWKPVRTPWFRRRKP